MTSPLGPLEQLVMTAIVQCGRDAYSVKIHQAVAVLNGGRKVSLSTIYTTLDRLEDRGLIVSWLSDPTPERRGHAKRCYRLEPAGGHLLRQSTHTTQGLSVLLEEILGPVGSRG